ncbi:putative lysozyme precursor [Actinacidiphila reveromycinica]|uniref:Lysozyme n=1 Tax=Actinacidiphila reveromycinica TaxID=659352 RepID=A0A7U3VQP7_9ACTN|nr:lysozyme [Streptomyces sp. SN-593]BBB00033.1 putative lysozyme precursor [Streptomyces sp. SN-593]
MSHGVLSVVHGTGSARTRLAVLVGLIVSLLTLAFTAPGAAHAAAATGSAAGAGHLTHPELDWMGSTVPAHEGSDTSGSAGSGAVTPMATQTLGMDVSGYQGSVNWATTWANGGRFAYVKATESTTYTNPDFAQQYNGSYNVGMIRGSYHFATPDTSAGATQADYFIAHGGGWSADGKTLPGALDIEYNPYGATCYGLSQASMVSWIHAFANEYHAREGVYPVIYSTYDWWSTCTGNNSGFATTSPFWIAKYSTSAGTLPAGYGYYTFWQHADSGTFPGDQDYFNGDLSRLQALALG